MRATHKVTNRSRLDFYDGIGSNQSKIQVTTSEQLVEIFSTGENIIVRVSDIGNNPKLGKRVNKH